MNTDNDPNFETIFIDGRPRRVLRNHGTMRVPLRMRDAARSDCGPVTDAYGRVKFHQPGYRFLDIGNRDAAAEKRQAYLDYQTETENAWRNPAGDVGSRNPTDQREGDIFTNRRPRRPSANGADGDASVNDARDTAYAEYLDYITNAWRTKPPRV